MAGGVCPWAGQAVPKMAIINSNRSFCTFPAIFRRLFLCCTD
jgi:hypothetical protein